MSGHVLKAEAREHAYIHVLSAACHFKYDVGGSSPDLARALYVLMNCKLYQLVCARSGAFRARAPFAAPDRRAC